MVQQQPPAILLKIDQAMRAGDMGRATSLARRALDSGHVDPVLYSLRSYWQEGAGRVQAALADLQRAVALSPDPRTLASMGRCLSKLGRFDEALQVTDHALSLDSGLSAAHYEKAFALEQTGELAQAKVSYERAVTLAPGMVDATARLAALASRRSDWEQTQRLAETALALDPGNSVAHFALVTRDLASGAASAAENRARKVVDAPNTARQVRAHGLGFLADALDAQDRTAEAFDAYTQSNLLLQEDFQGWFAGQETGLAFSRRMRHALEAMPAADSVAGITENPVFLVGFARAGTTLLGQILASHSRFVTAEEKPLLIDGMRSFLAQPDGFAKLATLSDDGCAAFRRHFWERLRAVGIDPAGRIVVDQTPLNTLHLALIARLFPGARIIFALRDPRDVVLSCFRRLFVLNAYTWEFLSLDRTAQFYDATMECAVLSRQKLPLLFHDIRNEKLVADFGGETRALCDFLGVDFDPAMAGFAERSRARGVATPSATQVAKGLSSEGIGQWRRYRQQLAPVLPQLACWVTHFDY